MHILFLTDNFPPEVNAPASRTFEHCRVWAKLGHRVSVITCAPNFPHGRLFKGYKNRLWQREMIDGIDVVRVWSYIAPNKGFSRRILDFVSYAFTATIAALFIRRCDLVVATSPQLFTAVAGWIVGGMKGIPFVFELRDLWPESIKAVGAVTQSSMINLLEKLELFLYRRARLIVSVTHAFRDNLVRRGIDSGKIAVITNGVDLERFKPMVKDLALVSEHELQDCFVSGYIGTLGMAHGLNTLVDAAKILQDRPSTVKFRMLILGDGAEKAGLKIAAARAQVDNILFVDGVSKQDVVRYWSILDISIIHLRNAELFATVIPSKLFEGMGMGIPVLLGVQGESAAIVEREKVGVVFEPENPARLANEIEKMASDPERLADLRRHCLAAAPRYDRGDLAIEMLAHLEIVCNKVD